MDRFVALLLAMTQKSSQRTSLSPRHPEVLAQRAKDVRPISQVHRRPRPRSMHLQIMRHR
jgi:hypothetical protein